VVARERWDNSRRVVNVRETTECGRVRRLVVAVGDFHTVDGLADTLASKRYRAQRSGTSRRFDLLELARENAELREVPPRLLTPPARDPRRRVRIGTAP
jgi:hypothetical protein